MKLIIETCCGSADDVVQSELGGADRAELNSALFLGGLTPSVSSLELAKEHTESIRIMTMVRPRSGGFRYTDLEFETMLRDAARLLAAGSDGIVFGFLREDGSCDIERIKRMLEVIGDGEAVFHRAFDVVPDWREAIDILAELGITRILTSGQEKSAWEGRKTLRDMISYAGDRIEILPGAGIRPHNARDLVRATGARGLHMSVRKTLLDCSVKNNPRISFGSPAAPDEFAYEMIDREGLKKAIQKIGSPERNK